MNDKVKSALARLIELELREAELEVKAAENGRHRLTGHLANESLKGHCKLKVDALTALLGELTEPKAEGATNA